MKFGPLDLPSLPALTLPRLPLAAFRRRIVFHGVFLLLALAVVVLAVSLLAEEKQRSRDRYEAGFRQRLSTMAAQLRHPSGQLALINSDAPPPSPQGMSPVVLPFSALDYSDPFKARQAVEMSGCAVHWPSDGGQLCVGVGDSAYAGGVVYLVADLVLPPAQAREPGTLELDPASHAVIRAETSSGVEQWVAPFEAPGDAPVDQSEGGLRGRVTGFTGEGMVLIKGARPVRDFRGWLWQDAGCALPQQSLPDCARRSLLSLRVPIESWRKALFAQGPRTWPPADLGRTRLRLQWLGPQGQVQFDSARDGAVQPFALQQLGTSLGDGEVLRVERLGRNGSELVTQLRGHARSEETAAPWLTRLVLRLPSADTRTQVQAQETVNTSSGRYQLSLSGDLSSVDRSLSATATRMSGFVGAMLAAILLAWLIIELGLIRRVAILTRRAAALRYNVQDPQLERRLGELDVSDLTGRDELGILAGSLATLLERIKEGARREHIRNEQERDMWHAVGHEIMSPLQSLMVLHGDPQDPSHRYVQRMQQAVRVLYGTASPSEAITAATVDVQSLDIDEFLAHVAENAPYVGIADVVYERAAAPVWVQADEHSLEDVVTHVLRNAERYRPAGTPIAMSLQPGGDMVLLRIDNQGLAIAEDMLENIFEYGVSDADAAQAGNRGQGLFVARTYMAKMGGTLVARNTATGVSFELRLAHAAARTAA